MGEFNPGQRGYVKLCETLLEEPHDESAAALVMRLRCDETTDEEVRIQIELTARDVTGVGPLCRRHARLRRALAFGANNGPSKSFARRNPGVVGIHDLQEPVRRYRPGQAYNAEALREILRRAALFSGMVLNDPLSAALEDIAHRPSGVRSCNRSRRLILSYRSTLLA